MNTPYLITVSVGLCSQLVQTEQWLPHASLVLCSRVYTEWLLTSFCELYHCVCGLKPTLNEHRLLLLTCNYITMFVSQVPNWTLNDTYIIGFVFTSLHWLLTTSCDFVFASPKWMLNDTYVIGFVFTSIHWLLVTLYWSKTVNTMLTATMEPLC